MGIYEKIKVDMPWIILDLLLDRAITLADLDGFSDDLKGRMEFLMKS